MMRMNYYHHKYKNHITHSLILFLLFTQILSSTCELSHGINQSISLASPISSGRKLLTNSILNYASLTLGHSSAVLGSGGGGSSHLNGCRTNTGDPDTIRSVKEIIESRGYLALEYDVVTRDGYILTIQRIINPLVSGQLRRKLKPVILQHGLMSSAADWVMNSLDDRPALYANPKDANASTILDEDINDEDGGHGHSSSLAFYLANRGYDVFLANSRGNTYGQRHKFMSSRNPNFWAFCFDEKIHYDLPAIIQFVRKLTFRKKVAYVGHSQGSAMMFGLMSKWPQWTDIVEPFVALAPVAYVNNAITPLRQLDFLTPYLQTMNAPFLTNRELINFLAARVCNKEVLWRDLCENIVFLAVGFDEDELDERRIAAYLCHIPCATSLRNLAHYGQEIRSGRFAHFDHGLWGNLQRYGRRTPPDYALNNIRSRSMVWFTAENDWLASPIDVARLASSLRIKPFGWVNMTEVRPLWNHLDFLFGKHTGQLLNPKVYHYLELFN